MKNDGYFVPVVSAIVGGGFFAIPYLALNVALLPALGIGAVAFGAANLLLTDSHSNDKIIYENEDEKRLDEIIKRASKQNVEIYAFKDKIESPELVKNIKEIADTINKIIDAVRRNPSKLEQASQFFNYYLPVTLKILNNYDLIENQRLNTEESIATMNNAAETLKKVNVSFKNQLAALYQAEIQDTDAELKVFQSILKQDGNNDSEFKIGLK